MGVRERLREFIKFKRMSERAFCREVGVSMSYVNSIRTSILPEKIKAIVEKYPELNPIWLLTGEPEGGMLLNGNNNQINGNGNTAVAGNGNQVTTNDIAGMIELQKGYQTMIKEKDDQINRLISVIEKLSDR
jgi:transcriptional regulator with XRE-family HTH domain